MTTPCFIAGFEDGIISAQGGGGASAISGVPTIESSIVHSGNYSMKIIAAGVGAVNFRRNTTSGSVRIAVARCYFRIPSGALPSATISIFGWQITTAAATVGLSITSAGVMRGVVGSGSAITGPNVIPDTWHKVDIRANITGTTWTLDWSVDGIPQTQAVLVGQSTTDVLQYLRLGSASTTVTGTMYFDDLVCSETSVDYPIAGGGTQYLPPDGSATSNPGVNIIEEANGTDAGASSYLALNSVPMGNATNYIKQVALGNTNYMGVAITNISATRTGIIGAIARLAYTSATTTANKGGCIVSKDSFSSFDEIWGQQAATQDYSDGSTASPYLKSVIVNGVVDDATVNALEIRLGYSDDINPVPYWLDVGVEVAYSTDVSTTISLDLVTHTSAFNDLTVLENEILNLDLVSHTSTINAISMLENEIVNLDLVSHTSSINDITILENVTIGLDFVSYPNNFNDLVVLENEIVNLDLVSYSRIINDLSILESILYDMDLVSYSITNNDLTILENDVIELDLVEYNSSFYDVSLTEPGNIDLETVIYSTSVYDLTVIENEIIPLDLVSYSRVMNDIVISENEFVSLDLVVFDYSVLDISFQSPDTTTPIFRCYPISKEVRYNAIESEERIKKIDLELRAVLIKK